MIHQEIYCSLVPILDDKEQSTPLGILQGKSDIVTAIYILRGSLVNLFGLDVKISFSVCDKVLDQVSMVLLSGQYQRSHAPLLHREKNVCYILTVKSILHYSQQLTI